MGRATMASRLKRLEIAVAASRPCTLCNGKPRVVFMNGIGGEPIPGVDTSPCAECGMLAIAVRFVNMLPPEARERERRAAAAAGLPMPYDDE